MRMIVWSHVFVGILALASDPISAAPSKKQFRAGAVAMDVSPTQFPTIVNGMFLERTSEKVNDALFARCLVLDDGATRIVLAVVDSCMIPRDILDEAKRIAADKTSIPTDKMMISATHTHSAPAAMGALGCPVDPVYIEDLAARIAEGIHQANQRLAPARIGWGVVDDRDNTHCRRWILRSDKMRNDPFGALTVHAHMHPGYQNPDFIGPSGPVDPGLSVLSVQSPEGRPVALLANYSMHYFGSSPVSADYFGLFCKKIAQRIGAAADPAFVAMMSQGTSGDQHWMDYDQPKKNLNLESYTTGVTQSAFSAYEKIQYRDWVSLDMAEATLSLRRRIPDQARLAWAEAIIKKTKSATPKNQPEVYAHEQIFLHESPVRELKLQAIRIGDLGITAIPNEVYAITGLKLKAQSPLAGTFNIELANGAEGYIPPPHQHHLGGYTTWPARTAALESQAEPQIVETLLTLLEKVAGRPRRPQSVPATAYADAVKKSKPIAYWRFEEWAGTTAFDASGHDRHGTFEPGVALYLPGPTSKGFLSKHVNRAVHFSGGRMKADVPPIGPTYSVEMWIWNGLPFDVRAVTGCLFSLGPRDSTGIADRLAIGGANNAPGRLIFSSKDLAKPDFVGKTELRNKQWHHVAFVRTEEAVAIYLNGSLEGRHQMKVPRPSSNNRISLAGHADSATRFEGKLDEVALYNRPLSPDEIKNHYTVAQGN